MMKLLRTSLAAALLLLVASAVAIGQDKKEKAAKRPAPSVLDRLSRSWERMGALRTAMEKMNLTDEQKTKVSEIRQEIGPKFKEVMEAMDGILTDQQKEARREAAEKASAAGKKGREMVKAVEEAMKLSDEQKSKLEEPVKKLAAIQSELVKKITGVLTEEQRAELKKALGGERKKPAPGGAKE